MPAARKPTEVLEFNGAFKHDSQRRRPIGPKSKVPFGSVPKYFTADEKSVWKEIVGYAPPNVLTGPDRLIVEVVARLVTKFRKDWLTGSELSMLRASLSLLGFSPADRSRVTAIEQEPADEFAEFRQ